MKTVPVNYIALDDCYPKIREQPSTKNSCYNHFNFGFEGFIWENTAIAATNGTWFRSFDNFDFEKQIERHVK